MHIVVKIRAGRVVLTILYHQLYMYNTLRTITFGIGQLSTKKAGLQKPMGLFELF